MACPRLSFSPVEEEALTDAIGRYNRHEPLQHIIGETVFYGRRFRCDSRALIPRPETEELVERIVTDHLSCNHLHVLDIGTGTGCIAISLALDLKNAEVDAVDISTGALALAQENADALSAPVRFHQADVLTWSVSSNIPPALECQYGIIVSNPPYIRQSERVDMDANVLDYEPHTALFVPDHDPLIFYRTIAAFAANHLKPDGALYFEINQFLSIETASLIRSLGFAHVEIINDLSGNARMIKARLR